VVANRAAAAREEIDDDGGYLPGLGALLDFEQSIEEGRLRQEAADAADADSADDLWAALDLLKSRGKDGDGGEGAEGDKEGDMLAALLAMIGNDGVLTPLTANANKADKANGDGDVNTAAERSNAEASASGAAASGSTPAPANVEEFKKRVLDGVDAIEALTSAGKPVSLTGAPTGATGDAGSTKPRAKRAAPGAIGSSRGRLTDGAVDAMASLSRKAAASDADFDVDLDIDLGDISGDDDDDHGDYGFDNDDDSHKVKDEL